MQQTFLARVVLPAALFLIMLGMGLSLSRDDFARVLRSPKAFLVGITCQMLLLPVVGWGVIHLVGMDQPELAVGLMVLTFCPGGTTSNMMTYLARGDVALSISLTAVVSLITPFTIPLLTAAVMDRLLGQGTQVELPLGKTIVALLAITVVPVGIGMLIHRFRPAAAAKADKPVKVMSVIFLLGIIAALVRQNSDELGSYFAQAGLATLLLNVTTTMLGYAVARAARLPPEQQVTVGMEVGIQNGTTALLVTGSLLGNLTMTVAPGIYSLIMFVTGGLFGAIANRLRAQSRHEAR